MKYILLVFCSLCLVSSCKNDLRVSQENIAKGWKLIQVLESNKDVTQDRDPNRNRVMELFENGRYATEGKPEPPDMGVWSLDTTNKNLLILDSDAGPGSDTKWNLWFSEDTLCCRGNSLMYKNLVVKWLAMP